MIKPFERVDVSIERMIKPFKRADVFDKRMSKPFERADVSIERMTEAVQTDANFPELLTNGSWTESRLKTESR